MSYGVDRLRTVWIQEPYNPGKSSVSTYVSCTFARTLNSRPRMAKPLVDLLHFAIDGVFDLVEERHYVPSVSRTEGIQGFRRMGSRYRSR